MNTTTDKIKVRSCQIINTAHPEWGTFGVMDEYEASYDIIGDAGAKNISKTEANRFWKVLEPTPKTDAVVNKSVEKDDGAFLAEDLLQHARDIERQNIELYDDKKRLEWLFSNASISLIEKGTGADWWTELDYGDPRNNIDQAMNTLK